MSRVTDVTWYWSPNGLLKHLASDSRFDFESGCCHLLSNADFWNLLECRIWKWRISMWRIRPQIGHPSTVENMSMLSNRCLWNTCLLLSWIWKCNFHPTSVGFASVGFASVGFASVGFASVGFASVGFSICQCRIPSDGLQKGWFEAQSEFSSFYGWSLWWQAVCGCF